MPFTQSPCDFFLLLQSNLKSIIVTSMALVEFIIVFYGEKKLPCDHALKRRGSSSRLWDGRCPIVLGLWAGLRRRWGVISPHIFEMLFWGEGATPLCPSPRSSKDESVHVCCAGPSTWSVTWPECSGPRQSPVKLDMCTEDTSLPSLIFQGHADVRPAGFRLHNTYQSGML